MLTFTMIIITKKAWLIFFVVKCTSELCDWSDTFSTSKTLTSNQRGRKAYEINLSSCIAFREIGRGYQSILNFCKLMNIPPPMDKKSYRKTFTKLYRAYSNVAYQQISKAAEDISITPEADGIKNITASFDGTWQRRGYSSLNGVVTCISEGKVLDYEVLCKVCPQCKYWNKTKTTAEHEEWKLYHDCTINHTGSAGSMEVAGVINIFKRSVETKKLRYTTYLGDGDSKSFKVIVESNIYPGHEVKKHECIGHVQKGVGHCLRTYKSDYESALLSDHKKLSGAGRLTNKVMNTLQNYYGMVIRSNVGNLYQMKKGIAAIIHHCSEYLVKVDGSDQKVCDDDARHKFCPEGLKSWCKYQKQKVSGGNYV